MGDYHEVESEVLHPRLVVAAPAHDRTAHPATLGRSFDGGERLRALVELLPVLELGTGGIDAALGVALYDIGGHEIAGSAFEAAAPEEGDLTVAAILLQVLCHQRLRCLFPDLHRHVQVVGSERNPLGGVVGEDELNVVSHVLLEDGLGDVHLHQIARPIAFRNANRAFALG